MKRFSGYSSRSSAGILADDPASPAYTRTDLSAAHDGSCSPAQAGHAALDDGDEAEFSTPLPRTGRTPFHLPFRILLLAILVNLLLAAGFVWLVNRDIRSLPKPVYYIFLTDHTPDMADSPARPSGTDSHSDAGHSENSTPQSAQ